MNEYDPDTIEKKWQDKWEELKMHHAKVEEDKDPFYIIFAYPSISGYLHLGHMRCYTYTDFIARYKKMRGYSVLFPAGAHPTGNQVFSFAKRVAEKDPVIMDYLRSNGASEEDIRKLSVPDGVIEFFKETYIKEWRNFGLHIDFSHFTDTSREDYSSFIRWQFKKLKDKGLLTQKPYYAPVCVSCGPVAVDPSETDLYKGGNAEVQEFTLLKFRFGERYITAATLRPETVYGQTNLWVDPDEDYVIVKVQGEEWIMSSPAMDKLSYQTEEIKMVGRISGRDMIGKYATAPVIHRDIPILPAKFTDPNIGSGIVTSVPSDAPYDWIALEDLKKNHEMLSRYDLQDIVERVNPIPIIESKEWGTNPAERIILEMGINSQAETDKLEDATQRIYKAGFHSGTMLECCGDYAGLSVQEAKERIRNNMLSSGEAIIFRDLSEEVICRCGEEVIMGKIPDQWFIRYSDEKLTKECKEHVKDMCIRPDSYANTIPDTLEWFQDRSCARMGNWRGTKFPFDDKWIVEAISDSTLYPAHYVVAKHYNLGSFQAKQMTEDFFDFVFLNEGSVEDVSDSTGIPEDTLLEVRRDFLYWYPLDINLGGKEHMTVHFPVFLMNHVAILDPPHWPKGIMVNWYLTMTGGKISKSKGGADPIPDVAGKFGIDTLRLYYAHSASPFVDKEWDEKEVFNYRKRLGYLWRLFHRIREMDGPPGPVDDYLRSRFNHHLKKAIEYMDSYSIRKTANVIFYDITAEFEWYFKRGGENGNLLDELGTKWIKLMSPFVPHLSDELGCLWGIEYVTTSLLPEVEIDAISDNIERREIYLKGVIEDIKNILDIAKVGGNHIHIYVTPDWKVKVIDRVLSHPEKGMGLMSGLVDELNAPPRDLSKFLKRALDEHRANKETLKKAVSVMELDVLEKNKDFLEKEFRTSVTIYRASEEVYDPENRKEKAIPGKPAIYIQ